MDSKLTGTYVVDNLIFQIEGIKIVNNDKKVTNVKMEKEVLRNICSVSAL